MEFFIGLFRDLFLSVLSEFLFRFFKLDETASRLREMINADRLREIKLERPKEVSVIYIIVYTILGGVIGFGICLMIALFIVIVSLGGLLFRIDRAIEVIQAVCVIIGLLWGFFTACSQCKRNE